ncbi:pilus assembly protein [Nocardiopsis dassonvillei]|uniref:TadE family protein n=1 Tax=Nocardiopsis dassonvillei TaxID=2014 RepID=UPI00201018C7|nr:TadE family protein [Nocardiopsis dassonvillei]MCK9871420.1 pilus assembly protein [Nocardiopsis dassonvillei]
MGPRVSDTDRGSSTLETAVLFPAVLLIVMAALQAGLWYHGRSVALAAAQEGVAAGRTEYSSVRHAHQAANDFAVKANALDDITVSTSGSSATRIRVTVTGRVPSLIPLVPISVSQESSGAVERWTEP